MDSTGLFKAGEMCVGYISTSQQSGSFVTAGQSVGLIAGGKPSIIAGKIVANSITVNNMLQSNITGDQNVNPDVQPVSHNDANVSRGNTIATGANSSLRKEGTKL